MDEQSTIKTEGTLEDVVISIYSWEYPTNIMVLQSKSNIGGYSLILGMPWLAIVDAYFFVIWRHDYFPWKLY
jgi:hypothetical protein